MTDEVQRRAYSRLLWKILLTPKRELERQERLEALEADRAFDEWLETERAIRGEL